MTTDINIAISSYRDNWYAARDKYLFKSRNARYNNPYSQPLTYKPLLERISDAYDGEANIATDNRVDTTIDSNNDFLIDTGIDDNYINEKTDERIKRFMDDRDKFISWLEGFITNKDHLEEDDMHILHDILAELNE